MTNKFQQVLGLSGILTGALFLNLGDSAFAQANAQSSQAVALPTDTSFYCMPKREGPTPPPPASPSNPCDL